MPCRFCQGNSRKFLQTPDRNRRITDEIFEYYKCHQCRCVFVHPIPPHLEIYYPADYYPIPRSSEEIETGLAAERDKLEILVRFLRCGRVLDVGASWGGFALLAKRTGFEVHALEMNPAACTFLRDTLNIPTIESNEIRAAHLPTTYDAVTFWQVIEHLPAPCKALEEAARCLNPGGVIIISAPNPMAFQFQILRGYWTHLDAPRHLQLLSVDWIGQEAARHGLYTVLATTSDPIASYWNVFGWRQSFHLLASRPSVQKLLRKIGGRIAWLVAPLERSGRRGSTYTIVLRKAPLQ